MSSSLAAIHRFQVNPSPQRHCPASLLARFFQNLKGHSGKYLQDSSWLMSSLVTEHEKTVKNQIAIGTIGSWCSNGITNQHWSISTYHSGRLWFFRSLQPCSLRLPVMSATVYSDNISLRNLWYLVVSSSFPHNPKGLRLGFCLRLCFRLGLGFRLRLRSSFGLTGQRQDLESLNNTGLLDLSEQLCLDT